MNVALVAIFLYLIEFDLPQLFGVGYSGINAFAHLMGFLLGFLSTIVWSHVLRQQHPGVV
jgi:membrane associated rhomboid family serine protease